MAAERRDSLLRRLLSEAILIGVSITLAMLMWLIASSRTDVTIRVPIPVRPINVPPNVEVNYEPDIVQLDLSLPANLRELVSGNDFEMPIDLSDLAQRAGIENVATIEETIVPGDVQTISDVRFAPHRVNRLSVYPRTVTIRARLITASFPLDAPLTGSPASGCHTDGSPQIQPIRVWLTGPQQAIDEVRTLRTLQTAPIELSGLTSGEHVFSPQVEIPAGLQVAGYRETEGGVLHAAEGLSLPETQVRVRIAEDISTRAVAGVEARPSLQRANLALADWQPRRFAVTVSGPISLISQLTSEDFAVEAADLSALADRAMSVAVRAEPRWRDGMPETTRTRVEILSVEPTQIEVTIAEREHPQIPPPVPAPPASPETSPRRTLPLLAIPASP